MASSAASSSGQRGARFALNEVPIVIPMPAVDVRILTYAFTKRAAQAAALRDIADLPDPLDGELSRWFTTPNARHAHRRYWQQLKGTEPTW